MPSVRLRLLTPNRPAAAAHGFFSACLLFSGAYLIARSLLMVRYLLKGTRSLTRTSAVFEEALGRCGCDVDGCGGQVRGGL